MFDIGKTKKDVLLKEINLEEQERKSLKKAYSELEQIDKEIMDEHKAVEIIDEKIVYCYEKLYEVLTKLNELKEKPELDPSEIMDVENLHNSALMVASELGKYLDRIKEDTIVERRGVDTLKKHFDKINKDLEKNSKELHRFKKKVESE